MMSTHIRSGSWRAVQEWWLLAVLFLVWGVASIFSWIPQDLFPDLGNLARATSDLAVGKESVFGTLPENVVTSVGRFAVGYALSVFVGLVLGLVMAASTTVASLTLPV